MITRNEIERLQRDVTNKSATVARTNNNQTRKALDDAIELLINSEKEYNNQRKTKIVEYSIGVRPIGSYSGKVEVWEDATPQEIKCAVKNDCEFYLFIEKE